MLTQVGVDSRLIRGARPKGEFETNQTNVDTLTDSEQSQAQLNHCKEVGGG